MQISNPKLRKSLMEMDTNQLTDSLTAHISLYHSKLSSKTDHNPNPRRLSILKWFSSLTVHQRQAHLTVVDPKFIKIVIQMQGKLRQHGHGFFIILPDVPMPNTHLPTLCFRKSQGLLSRSSQSNQSERSIYESIRLFNSYSSSSSSSSSYSYGFAEEEDCLDSMTVCEDFVVGGGDEFIAAMDGVSNGGFLSTTATTATTTSSKKDDDNDDWVELEWLKAKGYYSLEAFVANRLELALTLSWFHSSTTTTTGNNNKQKKKKKNRGGGALGILQKSKDKVGLSANVFWRNKGCMDWWLHLDPHTKTKLFLTFFGKAAKSLSFEILKGSNSAVEDEMWLFSAGAEKPLRYNCRVSCRRTSPTLVGTDLDIGSIVTPASLAHVFNRVVVLQDILALLSACQQNEYDKEKLFFSSLGSVGTISDFISRKLRGLLMLISLECTKHELLEEGNLRYPPKKSKEKPCATSRRKKGKTRVKRPNAVSSSFGNDLLQDELPKEQGSRLAHTENGGIIEPNCLTGTRQGKDLERDVLSSTVDMEHGRVFVNGKAQTAAGETSKESNKNKSSGLEDPAVVGDSPMRMKVCSSRVISEVETAKSNCMSDKSIIQCVSNDISVGNEKVLPMSRQSSIIPPVMPLRKVDDVLSNGAFFGGNGVHLCETDTKAVFFGEPTKVVDPEEKPTLIQEQESVNNYDTRSISSSGCPSHEWPTVAPFHFPSINPHLPAATDRLHLDVGHNWHNHFHHSFVPTVHHQAKSSSMENGARVLSRPLPMSLDCPPMVRSFSGLAAPLLTCSYDSGFMDLSDPKKSPELGDELENHWISEEEYEVHAVSGKDYNQYFGGGVMYWNPSDHPGPSFSRPPSLSSDDSSWAWREADINRAVDDMVAFSSSYSTNGLTSPSAASFCSPFDPLGSAHQAIGYVIPGSEVADVMVDENASGSVSNLPGDGDAKAGDSLPYPILRPIIVPNVARERSRSDFKRGHDHKSPCVPPNRRDQPIIKRPPSPVVLCVPRAPLPPPPSPVSDSRKHRGFPTVRSGSSSPRHWGVKGWFHDGINFEEACVHMDGSEIVWPSWRNKILSPGPMIQPLPGALLQDRLIAISQLARDQEHPDVAFPLQPPELLNAARKASLSLLYSLLHDEIDSFCKQVATENMIRKPYVNWAVKRVTRSLQVLWPRSRTNIFGSNATGLSLPSSDVDLVVCLPPVRNLEPIKEAGILEGRNGIKETCLQHAARYLANQEWVKNDSLKIVENTAIPIIMLVVEVPHDLITAASNVQTLKEEPTKIAGEHDMIGLKNSASSKCTHISNHKGNDAQSVRLDISFKSPSHTGLQTTELVKELTEQFPAATPLALVLKQFLADRTLDQSYSGGLSSYCLVLLITRFLQHEHHFGRPINQNFGCLLMDFLYFFGNVFDPRQMRISVQGSGVYINRERGYSIDPIYIDDPLFPANNVGRNCFRIHQCIKAFADAYSVLENELACLPNNDDSSTRPPHKLLPKIIPSISLLQGL